MAPNQTSASGQALGTYLSTLEAPPAVKNMPGLQRDIPRVPATCCGKLKGGMQTAGQSPQTGLLEQRCSSTHRGGSNLYYRFPRERADPCREFADVGYVTARTQLLALLLANTAHVKLAQTIDFL